MTGQQAHRQYALADDIHRYWRLDQCFTLFTRPIPADMAFDGEDAGRVVELFAGIFTDALDCTAALAVAVVQFVMDRSAYEETAVAAPRAWAAGELWLRLLPVAAPQVQLQ